VEWEGEQWQGQYTWEPAEGLEDDEAVKAYLAAAAAEAAATEAAAVAGGDEDEDGYIYQEYTLEELIPQMRTLGYTDEAACEAALGAANNDIVKAMEILDAAQAAMDAAEDAD